MEREKTSRPSSSLVLSSTRQHLSHEVHEYHMHYPFLFTFFVTCNDRPSHLTSVLHTYTPHPYINLRVESSSILSQDDITWQKQKQSRDACFKSSGKCKSNGVVYMMNGVEIAEGTEYEYEEMRLMRLMMTVCCRVHVAWQPL